MAAEKQIMVLRVRTEFRKSDVLVHYILASSNFQLAYDCVHLVKFQISDTCYVAYHKQSSKHAYIQKILVLCQV